MYKAPMAVHFCSLYAYTNICNFMQFRFNLSNGVTDTLESSSILIYLETHKGIYSSNFSFIPGQKADKYASLF
jgi:hypothetical protein